MGIPFIELFRTPNGCYFYEANKNELVPINEVSFCYLQSLLTDKNPSTTLEPEEIAKLRKMGYLAEQSVVQQVRHPCSEYLAYFLDRKLTGVTLQLTQNCNLRCKYCIYSESSGVHQRSHSTKRMSWEMAKKAIDFLWEHSVDSKKVNIGFYGGEPLLEFPLIQRTLEYSLERFLGKELTFGITSNGTLLNDDIIRFFEAHDVSLVISLDGPKDINDANRVFADGRGTFDTVLDRINRIKEVAPEYAKKISISMVMNPENDFDCINSICIPGADLDKLSVLATIVDLSYSDQVVSFSEEYLWKFRYQQFLAILSYYKRFSMDDLAPIAHTSVTTTIDSCTKIASTPGLRPIDCPAGPCMPGQLRLFVNAYGQLLPCERVSEKSAAMNIGSLDEGFNIANAYNLLNVGEMTEDICKKCWCFRMCKLCAKKADDESECLSPESKLSHCYEVKMDARDILNYLLLLKEVSVYYPAQVRTIPQSIQQ